MQRDTTPTPQPIPPSILFGHDLQIPQAQAESGSITLCCIPITKEVLMLKGKGEQTSTPNHLFCNWLHGCKLFSLFLPKHCMTFPFLLPQLPIAALVFKPRPNSLEEIQESLTFFPGYF